MERRETVTEAGRVEVATVGAGGKGGGKGQGEQEQKKERSFGHFEVNR